MTRVDWLNYQHLLYFWSVARSDSLVAASKELRLAPSTVSAQIKQLEKMLGARLFDRVGRRLVLTGVGRITFEYAEDIFGLGRELLQTVRAEPGGRRRSLRVGIANVVPKLVTRKILAPALEAPITVRLVCREDRPERLLAELALHHLDMVLSDAPRPPRINVVAYNHLLGQCGVLLFGTAELADRYKPDFPDSLNGAPFLLPTDETALRRSLEQWMERHSVKPEVVAEFDDSSLMKTFGHEAIGVFAAPAVIEDELIRDGLVKTIGPLEGVYETFYAISGERRVRHPAVAAIVEAAHDEMFG